MACAELDAGFRVLAVDEERHVFAGVVGAFLGRVVAVIGGRTGCGLTPSMQGLPVMRLEYAAKGQTYSSVAVITNLPAVITVAKASPTAPEVRTIRSIFMKMNADFGTYSPNYNVTLA